MMPDTPASIPGNAQFHFLTRVSPHQETLRIDLEWPGDDVNPPPGFGYPDNQNFREALPWVCYQSEDLDCWERLETVETTGTGVAIHLPPDSRARYISTGIPFSPERYESLLAAAEESPHCEVGPIGLSRLGRPLYGIRVRPSEAPALGTFFLQAYQHHTEFAGLHVLDSLLRGMMDGTIDRGRFHWAVIPCLNPDALYGGWREDLRHVSKEKGKGGNFNRDWQAFDYPETRAAREFFLEMARRDRLLHALDCHMGWSDTGRSGAGLTVFVDKSLPPELARRESRFVEAFFSAVPLQPFAWKVSDVNRPNFAGWILRTFETLGQTLEISRFEAVSPEGKPCPVDQSYYPRLAHSMVSCLTSFYTSEFPAKWPSDNHGHHG